MSNQKLYDLSGAMINVAISTKNIERDCHRLWKLRQTVDSSADKKLRDQVHDLASNLSVFSCHTEDALKSLRDKVAELEKMSNAQGMHSLRNLNAKEIGNEVFRNMTR